MKIVLLRHCEVEEEYQGCYNGHNDIGLSRRGREDAKRVAKRFAGELFERVYCSDLRRARETLEPFEQAKDAIYTEKLREKSWGRHEGKRFEQIIAEEKIEYKSFAQWIEALDGEDSQSYVKRIEALFFEEFASLDAKRILVVTHVGVIRTLMAIVKKIPLEEAFGIALPYGEFVVFDTKEKCFSTVK